MTIYIILILVILIGGIILGKFKSKRAKCIYCVSVGIFLLFLIGCRNINLGIVDTSKIYIPSFEKIIYMNMGEVIEWFNKDVVFYVLTKIFTYISTDKTIWLILVALPLMYAITKTTYKYSKIPSLSFILFIALNYYGMNFTLMRHSVALAFILLSYPYLKEKKLVKFIIYVVIATCFHKTALAFLIAYPIINIKFNWKQIVAIGGVLIIAVLSKTTVLNVIFAFLQEQRFQSYADRGVTLSITPFIINTGILIFSYIYCKLKCKIIDKETNMLLNLCAISSAFLTLTIVIGEAYRIAMFFGIFNILLLPNVLKLEKNMKNKFFIYIPIYGILILYFLFYSLNNAMINPYLFFWQN